MRTYRFDVIARPVRPVDPTRTIAALRRVGAVAAFDADGRVIAAFSLGGADYADAQHHGLEAVLRAGLRPLAVDPHA